MCKALSDASPQAWRAALITAVRAAVFPQGSIPWGFGRDSVLPPSTGVGPWTSTFPAGELAVSSSVVEWEPTGLNAEPPVEAAACCHPAV